MENNRPKSLEGIRAHIRALEAIQKASDRFASKDLSSIRRIARSLRHLPSFPQEEPPLTQAVTTLEKAADSDIPPRLTFLLSRLKEWVVRARGEKTTLLLATTDLSVSQRLQKELDSNLCSLHSVKTLKEAESVMAQRDIAFLILDLELPDGDGRDLLVRIRGNPATLQIPVVVLSPPLGNGVQTECFALGADMYFEKPLDLTAVCTAIAAKLQRYSDLTRRSTIDPVTHLPNRMVFYNAFTRAARLASRTREPLSIAILDLDRFKSVNDLSGHQMGDRVLQQTSAVLLQTLRTSDLLARWGGEEFAVLFPNTNLKQARLALNKALAALRRQTFETPEKRPFRMTFSAGVTQVEKGTGVEQAIAEADRYLYIAKAAGRNHVLSKEDRLDTLKKNILLVEDDDFMASLLRRFLEKQGFRIFHAKDAQMALSLSAETSFSLITLDVKLPDMDGFALLERFRKNPSLHRVPIIMITSSGDEAYVVRGFQLGADDYIVKPFSPSQFLARLRRFLEKQS